MTQSENVPKDEAEKLLVEQAKLEEELRRKMEARKNQQIMALHEHMEQKRHKRLDAIGERQEREKMQVKVL